jgi:dipeptidyl-peptidase-4
MSLQAQQPVATKPLDTAFLRLYAETRAFSLGRPVNIKPTHDGKAVLFLRSGPKSPKRSLFEFNVATGKTRELLTADALLKGAEENLSPEEKARRERMRLTAAGFADFQYDESGRYLLLPLSGKLFIFDRDKESARELKTPAGVIDPKWSRDGKMIAYVRDYDVYAYDLGSDKETQVTKGGTLVKTNGLAEFVAQEEMARFTGYWWSPDSKFIAFEEADHDGVEMWYVADPTKPDQKPQPQYYPRPGKKNVSVRLGIIPVTGGNPVWVEWDRKEFEYLVSVRWDKHGPLTIQVQDRKQQEIQLLRVDPATGKTVKLLHERDVAFTNIRQDFPRWLPGGREFLWISEFAKGPGLQLHNAGGSLSDVLIPVDAGLISVVHYDQAKSHVVYIASTDPTQAHVHVRPYEYPMPAIRRPYSDKSARLGSGVGMESVVYSENKETWVLTQTAPGEMPRSFVQREGKVIGELPSVAENPPFKPSIKFEKLGAGEGFYTSIIRPKDFDAKKKYPVVVDVYGGPHHIHVLQAGRNSLLTQWLADQGFIVVAVDNRGTPGRGRDWERSIYQKFGSITLDDQVAGLKLLGEKYPEMDMSRVGIVGWSFGGYMSALAALKRPDIYKAAVAGAPVTDWEDYDSHYTERYMGVLPESKTAYTESSLLPLAPKLESKLLLVHGTADDNVYFRHTLRLTDALFRAGKEFEVLPLPSLTHMVPDPIVTERLWSRVAGHFKKNLGEAK